MKTAISFDVVPFEVPYYVRVRIPEVPGQEVITPAVKIESMDARTLEAMCEDFRRRVFEKAGVTPPPQEGAGMSLDALADRFLQWPVPESVCADPCVIRQAPNRVGTNLLSKAEALEMLGYVLAIGKKS